MEVWLYIYTTLDPGIESKTANTMAKICGIYAAEGEEGWRGWLARDHEELLRYLDQDTDVPWRGARYSGTS